MNFKATEKAEGDVGADVWASAIIKVSCLLVIGVLILSSVVSGNNITTGPYAVLFTTVQTTITSGYTIAALMIFVVGAGALMHFLGFL
jgi:tetrahydromethanopterin S-methyltransferase subunit E